jgi:hypothetical protein
LKQKDIIERRVSFNCMNHHGRPMIVNRHTVVSSMKMTEYE